jgi:ABC-2 type transport system ATP-binding protein
MNQAAIEIQNLTKKYGDFKAVNGITFSVPQGSIFGFMGHNGAGKTTTIRMLLGLTRPTAGGATIAGLDSQSQSLQIRRLCGYLPGVFSLPGEMTPMRFLRYIASMFGQSGPAVESKIHTLLEQFDLLDVKDKKLKAFSQGMQQKVGLAQALINDPQILFLDEPTAGLDPLGREDFLQYIKYLSSERGVTILFSTHILSDIESVCRDVAIMHKGNILAQGALDQLKANHAVERIDDLYLRLARGEAA